MSKLSIRPRNLDACKFLPIYKCEEIPDLNDYASINRSIPQLPTGMEKEEESEHHLQRAISAQQTKGTTGELVIPTPEVYNAPESFYSDLYPQSFKLPRQLIHVQPFAFENDVPDYDRDSEDEQWLASQGEIPNLTALKFEELIDCFEKSSSQHVISPKEAKSLIKEDESIIFAVYDYWLNKRLRLETPLIPMVKTERRETSTNNSNNPYIAFRRRTEKMQTRKNRKNDEISYEKMIKLRRDLSRSMNLLQLVRQREETKRELVKMTVDIFEKRYLLSDYNGNIINELSAQRQAALRQASNSYLQSINNVLKPNENKPPRALKDGDSQPRKKREYKKRHRPEVVQRTEQEINELTFTSDDDDLNDNQSHSISDQDEDDSDGPFAFKRKKGCQYYAPLSDSLGNWPDYSVEERMPPNQKKKYCLTQFDRNNKKFYEYTRRRVGRGGRIIFDRTPFDYSSIDHKVLMNEDDEDSECVEPAFDYFRPKSPFQLAGDDEAMDVDEDSTSNDLLYIENGNLNSSVPINLNDFLHANDDVFSECRTRTDADLAKFRDHQKELIEMQKLQKDKLFEQSSGSRMKSDSLASHNQPHHSNHEMISESTTKATNLDLISSSTCNSKMSSSSISTNLHNSSPSILHQTATNITKKSLDITSLPQSVSHAHQRTSHESTLESTLDSESVSFAVSAVLSTSTANSNNSSMVQSSNTASTPLANGPAQLSNSEKLLSFHQINSSSVGTTLSNSYVTAVSNSINPIASTANSSSLPFASSSNNQPPYIQQSSMQQQTTNASSPIQQFVTQSQWSNQQITAQTSNELTNNSSGIFKIKFPANNNQNSLTQTDVT